MTDDELLHLAQISENITKIADRLQSVIENYDTRIVSSENRLAELQGKCYFRGQEKLRDMDDITKRIEAVERKINFLIISNVFAFVLFAFIAFIIFNPGFHAVFMHVFTTVIP